MQLPQVGYGTFYATDKARLKAALHYAIEECGIRSIDTAWSYFNQEIIGETLQEIFSQGKISRKDIFITSKLWNTHHRPDLVEKELLQTLHQLNLDYIDLFLIHTPASFKSIDINENKKITDDDAFPKDETGKIIMDNIDIFDTYRAMEAVQKKGLCRFIGVSNFKPELLNEILSKCQIKPYAIQNECHVYNQQKELLKICEENDIFLMAHTTIGRPPTKGPKGCALIEDPEIIKISKNHDVKPSQVCIRFLIQKSEKYVAIPMSLNPVNIKLNSQIDFDLDDEEMKELEELNFDFNFEMPKKKIEH